MSGFAALAPSLDGLSGPTAAGLVGASADVVLVLDAEGVVLRAAGDGRGIGDDDVAGWVGRAWADTVAIDSVDKVRDLVARLDPTRERQVNQRFGDGREVLVAYHAVRLDDGSLIALGRDLSSLTRMQQRLVNVQQSMERDYSKLRQFEARYRLLFQTASEAILIASAANARVVEANPAACELLGTGEKKLVGSTLTRWFDDAQRASLEDAIASLRVGGKALSVTLPGGEAPLLARLSTFKSEGQSHLLVRLQDASPAAVPGAGNATEHAARLLALVENAPDALVVTDAKGRLLTANTEFLDMAQVTRLDQVLQIPLADWLGQGGIDYDVIMASLREHGSIRLYTTQMLGEFGSVTDVEVSAVSIETEGAEIIGFAIRNIGRRVAAANDDSAQLSPRSVDQLTQLVGRVPLKELVRESTDLIEQLCIQAALKLTGNNRASAAEMLGLSRQSLYVKLRRYSLEEDDEGEPSSGSGQSRGRR